ncbi:MAG: MBL fold metallo-hydrolase [Marinibacterium sp.]|nr:MBL fold metallo-hydrolase [Marinibacterium sp.]
MVHRREFMLGAGLLAGLSALGWRVAPAGAEGLVAARQYAVGDATVTVLSDGFISIGPDMLFGITPEDFAMMLEAAHLDPASFPAAVNAFLIDSGDRRILVDAGTGTSFGPTLGKLPSVMAALGIDPASIDTVVFTHLHPDHVGGVLAEGGNPFANATLRVAQADVDFFTNEDIKAQAPDGFKPFFDMAAASLAAFGERVEPFDGVIDIAPGLTTMPMPGHTVGHSGLLLENDGGALLIAADVIHVPAVQLARPDVTIGFDTDQDVARATRQRVFDMAATDRLMIAGSHIALPGIGHLERAGDGYRFLPARHQYN